MKLTMEFKEMERMNKVMSLLGSEKDAVVNFTTGVSLVGKNYLNLFRITTATEQLEGRFEGTISGENPNVSFGVLLSPFLNVLGSILSYKESVYLEFEEPTAYIGVGENIHIPLSVVADSMDPIIMHGSQMAFQLTIDSKKFDRLASRAFYFADNANADGFTSAVFRFNMKNGELRGYSSNANGIATSKMQVVTLRQSIKPDSPKAAQVMEVADAMDNVLTNYCALEENSSLEDYCVAVPVKAVRNIRILALMGEVFGMSGDEHHLFVMSSDELTVYTCTKSAGFNRAIFSADDAEEPTHARLNVDAEHLKKGFQLMTKIMDVNNYTNMPVRLKVTETVLELSVTHMKNGVIQVPLLAQEGAGLCSEKEWYVAPKLVLPPVNSLESGNALIYFPEAANDFIFFGNGELDEGLGDSYSQILQVRGGAGNKQ